MSIENTTSPLMGEPGSDHTYSRSGVLGGFVRTSETLLKITPAGVYPPTIALPATLIDL